MFTKVRQVRAFESVIKQMEAAILQGSLSVGDRLPSTLQTIRRRTVVRAVPWEEGGYLLEVIVLKELCLVTGTRISRELVDCSSPVIMIIRVISLLATV